MGDIVDLPLGLSSGYERLYESGKYADISIHIGREPDYKVFLAHTLVLRTRSAFFENELTRNTVRTNELQQIVMVYEDISPAIFELLLRFIYSGKVVYNSSEGLDWIALLEGANMFELDHLITAIQDYLINQQEKWIWQNILTVSKCALSSSSLRRLLNYCNQVMISSPDIILTSNDVASLSKETIIILLRDEELNMDEEEIWMSAIQWAIKQVPGLEDNPASWTSNAINAVRAVISDLLPHIRFFSISPKAFNEKVMPYIELLPKKLQSDIINYHTGKGCVSKIPTLPPRKRRVPDFDSVIINKQQAEWILQKIVELTNQEEPDVIAERNSSHKLTLLYRQSRDSVNFQQMCQHKGATIVIGKTLGTDEILGGYNPVAWGTCPNAYIPTTESFLFALDKNMPENSIVSFVIDNEHAVYDCDDNPAFGYNGIDLWFGHDATAQKESYEKPLGSTLDGFKWSDWEVFLVELDK